MTPLEKVTQLYKAKNGQDARFETELCYYLQHGWVWVNPEFCVLARPCNKDIPESYTNWEEWTGEANAWYCPFAAGSIAGIKQAIILTGKNYEWCVFERANRRDGFRIVKTKYLTL